MKTITETRRYLHLLDCGMDPADAEFVAQSERDGFTITITPEWEDEDPKGFFDDPTAVRWVRKQIKDGNIWGWCWVKVTVDGRGAYPGDTLDCEPGTDFTAETTLSACSYENRAGFMAGGYFIDMVWECIEELKMKWAGVPA